MKYITKLRENAKQIYQVLIEFMGKEFEAIYQDVPDYESFQKEHGSLQKAKKDFEYLLQYSAVEIAFANDDLSNEEFHYIRSLSCEYDFCDFLQDNGYDDITWNNIYYLDKRELESILKNTAEYFSGSKFLFFIYLGYRADSGFDDLIKLFNKHILTFVIGVNGCYDEEYFFANKKYFHMPLIYDMVQYAIDFAQKNKHGN